MRAKLKTNFEEYRIEVQIKMAKIRYIVNQLSSERHDARLDQIRVCAAEGDRIWQELEGNPDDVLNRFFNL